MKNEISQERFDRLQEIKVALEDLLCEAKEIVRSGPHHIYERATAYWLNGIEGDIDGNCMCSMQDTIDQLEGHIEGDEEDNEDDEDDGTNGQDRKCYTDDQDRENYTVDPKLK